MPKTQIPKKLQISSFKGDLCRATVLGFGKRLVAGPTASIGTEPVVALGTGALVGVAVGVAITMGPQLARITPAIAMEIRR